MVQGNDVRYNLLEQSNLQLQILPKVETSDICINHDRNTESTLVRVLTEVSNSFMSTKVLPDLSCGSL